jgi:hypothetical protein
MNPTKKMTKRMINSSTFRMKKRETNFHLIVKRKKKSTVIVPSQLSMIDGNGNPWHSMLRMLKAFSKVATAANFSTTITPDAVV